MAGASGRCGMLRGAQRDPKRRERTAYPEPHRAGLTHETGPGWSVEEWRYDEEQAKELDSHRMVSKRIEVELKVGDDGQGSEDGSWEIST